MDTENGMKGNTLVKCFKCQYCEKEFSLAGHKKSLEMIHTGERPHKFQYRKKGFSQAGDKKRH